MATTPISIRLDDATAARIDRLVTAGVARDRTDAIRRGVAALDVEVGRQQIPPSLSEVVMTTDRKPTRRQLDVAELQILAFAYAEAHASYRMVPCDAYSRARAAALGDLLAAVCGQEVAP